MTAITDSYLGDPHMTGCVKGFQMHRVLYSEDRLRKPLIANGPKGGEFREASWDKALDLVAERLTDVKTRHGASSILHLGGSGSNRGSLHNTNRLTKRFLAMFGGSLRGTQATASAPPHSSHHMYLAPMRLE